jgi:hypothetical protein
MFARLEGSGALPALPLGEMETIVVNVGGRSYRKREISREQALAAGAAVLAVPSSLAFVEGDSERVTKELSVPSALVGAIIGTKGSTIERIKSGYGVSVQVPRGKQESLRVRVSGPEDRVDGALLEIESLVESRKASTPYTHFVSLPCRGLEAQLSELRKRASGWDPSLLVGGEMTHLTLCMLKLFDKRSIDQAGVALRSAVREWRGGGKKRSGGVTVSFHGLDVMGDDPSDAHVVFSPPMEGDPATEQVLALASCVVSNMHRAGLLSEVEIERQRLRDALGNLGAKLHLTVANTRYRRETASASSSSRASLDATDMVGEGSDWFSAEVALTAVCVSRRGKADPSTKYYPSEAEVAL